ncbi:3784_t:CDS:1, partial [Gigaspora rosea]
NINLKTICNRYVPQQVDKNHVFEIENEIESFNTGFAEDTVDIPLILLKELIPANRCNDIVEIWEIVCHRCTKKNHIVLFNDHSHLCTCLGLVRCGIVYQNFFRLLENSLYAKFHIMLIPRRWYKTKKQLEEMSILCQQPFTDSIQESSEETVYTETYIELPYKVADISYK